MYHPTLARRLWTVFKNSFPRFVSVDWDIHCDKSQFRERESRFISIIEELEVVCKTIWT